jgi:hypothetical protein
MSNEGSGAAPCSTADLSTTNDDEFSRAVLQRIEDGVHATLDVLDSGSNEMLRSLILPAHVPIIVGALVKVAFTLVVSAPLSRLLTAIFASTGQSSRSFI